MALAPTAICLLCAASLTSNLLLYANAQPVSAVALLLQLASLLGIGWQLWRRPGTINLRPQELAERMLQVQEAERQRLSRELHDDIGQSLTAARLQLEGLQRRSPEALQPRCRALRDTLDETLSSVRDVSALLNPRQLTSLGLEASLRAHLLRTLDNSGVGWSLECRQRLGGIGDEMAMAAFRITQEAVTNVLRHAKARNLLVSLARTAEGLRVTIQDDGVGFVPVDDPAATGQRGMAGMQERAAALQGVLRVSSQPGHGTRIEAVLPWPPRRDPRAATGSGHD